MSASAILKPQAAGFSTEQVTALAEFVDTQADLDSAKHKLGTRIDAVERGVAARIDAFERSLGSKIDAFERKLDSKITRLEGDFASMNWMMGFVLAFEIALFYKLFLH